MSGGGKRKEESEMDLTSGQANHFRSSTFDCDEDDENNIFNLHGKN